MDKFFEDGNTINPFMTLFQNLIKSLKLLPNCGKILQTCLDKVTNFSETESFLCSCHVIGLYSVVVGHLEELLF